MKTKLLLGLALVLGGRLLECPAAELMDFDYATNYVLAGPFPHQIRI
jgi:hypothetical protein